MNTVLLVQFSNYCNFFSPPKPRITRCPCVPRPSRNRATDPRNRLESNRESQIRHRRAHHHEHSSLRWMFRPRHLLNWKAPTENKRSLWKGVLLVLGHPFERFRFFFFQWYCLGIEWQFRSKIVDFDPRNLSFLNRLWEKLVSSFPLKHFRCFCFLLNNAWASYKISWTRIMDQVTQWQIKSMRKYTWEK